MSCQLSAIDSCYKNSYPIDWCAVFCVFMQQFEEQTMDRLDELKNTQDLDKAMDELLELSRKNDEKSISRIETLYRLVKDYYLRKDPVYGSYQD